MKTEEFEQLSFIKTSIPKMPAEYYGKELTQSNLVKNIPRQWTNDEIEWCLRLRNEGYSVTEIADSIGRDKVSTSIKLKRLTKKDNTYNQEHLTDKYALNEEFYNLIKPTSILDVYSGVKQYWANKGVLCISNDIDTSLNADYHMDALKFVCQEYLGGRRYDLIDLDPYGSAFDCFDLVLKMADKGLIVTYGELGHKRFKRLDYVRNSYEIDDLTDFTIDNMILKTQEIARHNHKELIVYKVGNWRNISRVYYMIKPLKITEQWEKQEDFPEDISDFLIYNAKNINGEEVISLNSVKDALEHYYYE